MQPCCGQVIKGKNVEEKIKSIEKVLKSYRTRLSTKVIGIIPPIPIFENVDKVGESGIIIQRLFPLPGTITKACLMIKEYEDNKGVTFTISSEGPVVGIKKSFETRKHLLVENVNLSVNVGDLVTLKVEEPHKVRGVFLGAVFEVTMEDMKKEELPLDEFLRLLEMEEG